MWGYFLHVITACTSCCLRLYFSESLLVLPCRWRDYFVFSTFGLCRVSCTSYIKWVYCSCRMVVLLVVKYMNFLAGDGILLFFVHLDFGWLTKKVVLRRLKGCTARTSKTRFVLSKTDGHWMIFTADDENIFVFPIFFVSFFVFPILSGWNGRSQFKYINFPYGWRD
jgi:hypothetical protein